MAQRWVRGKALEAVIALGEIKPGDELVFEICYRVSEDAAGRRYPHNHEDDTKYLGKTLVVGDIDQHPGFPINVAVKNTGKTWSICYCSIKAWRRPCPKNG